MKGDFTELGQMPLCTCGLGETRGDQADGDHEDVKRTTLLLEGWVGGGDADVGVMGRAA